MEVLARKPDVKKWRIGSKRRQRDDKIVCVSHTVHYKTVNWRKSNQKCTGIVYIFLKFIYLSIAPTCFGYCLAIIRVLVIWYIGKRCVYFPKYSSNDCIFENIHISVLQFYFTIC